MKTIRINFRKEYQIWKIASTVDFIRPVMEHIYFNNGYGYSTNASIAVKIPINQLADELMNTEYLEGKMIHWRSYKEILKYDTVKITPEGVECVNGSSSILYKYADIDTKYPDVEKLLSELPRQSEGGISEIGFDPQRLQLLSIGLGVKRGVRLSFIDKTKAITVKDLSIDNKGVGVIMPCLIDL